MLHSLLVWIYGFQTLIAGLSAFLGALLTVWIIRKQIKQAENERLDRLMRKSRAVRSSLPFALTAVRDFAEASAEYARSLPHEGRDRPNTAVRLPEFPPEAIVTLKEGVEYAENGWDEPIADLLNDLQVAQSRLRGASGQSLKLYASLDRLADKLTNFTDSLHGKAARLFPYARNEMENPIDLEPVRKGTLFIGRPDLGKGFRLDLASEVTN